MSEEQKKLYVGQKIVKQISEPEGLNLVGVLYEDGTNEDFTKAQWESVKSEESYPGQIVHRKKYNDAVKQIIEVLVDNRCTLGTFRSILEMVDETIGSNYRKSIAKTYNVEAPDEVMLGQIHEHLLGLDEKKDV